MTDWALKELCLHWLYLHSMYIEAISTLESENRLQASDRYVELASWHTLPSPAVAAVVAPIQISTVNLGRLNISGYPLLDGVQPQSRLICPDHMNESCAKRQKILRPSTSEEVRLWCSPCLDVCLYRCSADTRQVATQELVQTHAEVTAGVEKGWHCLFSPQKEY